MSEPYLTMAEIEAQYPNQWVLIANPKVTKYQEVLGGQVVLHCPDRVAFHQQFEAWDDPTTPIAAVQYIGEFPDESGEVLPSKEQPGAA
jgi:hypothetical protein